MWKLFEIANLATADRKTFSPLVRSKFSAIEKLFVDSIDLLEYCYESEGANATLKYVTDIAEQAVDELKVQILQEFTRKRIDDTITLGVDRVDQ